ncbi:peptidase U32 family protein [Desulfocicer niacini]
MELLAPGGDLDSIKAAITAGADAVYCGLNKFNARDRATNIDFEDLNGILNFAHRNTCKVFLTLNIMVVGSEIPLLISLLNKLVNTSIDGIIVQDLGLFYLLSTYFKTLEIHASTQLTTHNEGQILFLSRLAATRVNLSRELSLEEIKALTTKAHAHNIQTEVFVHGSQCISFSGICYMSSVMGGNSGNRGRCSQPCRDRYITTPQGKNFPLNLKDNCAYQDLRQIYDAGVTSLKIEGRIKKSDYVYTVVNTWRKQLREFYTKDTLSHDTRDLYNVFNRDFSDGYLKGDITPSMFIDNPRDNSIKHLIEINALSRDRKRVKGQKDIFEEKAEIKTVVNNKIASVTISKQPLTLTVSGRRGTPLNISVRTPETAFEIISKTPLVNAVNTAPGTPHCHPAHETAVPTRHHKKKKSAFNTLDHDDLFVRLSAINDTEYYIEALNTAELERDLFISFNEFSAIKKKILFRLNGSRQTIEPIEVPFLKKQPKGKDKPGLSVLISSREDAYLADETSADIYFQLPNGFKRQQATCTALFLKNRKLIPWFPSILIGEDYRAAVSFLEELHPRTIVTNNTGIAHEAWKKAIPWIAGPHLNIANSFSLLCLKEAFNCHGSFISNELSKFQIKRMIQPENFTLYYSIYHPILLMTSRQCLTHQVTGCEKACIDEDCIQNCNRSSTLTNLKNDLLFIKKTKGNYHSIYHRNNFLNTDILTDVPGIFSSFFIDLRDIKTETKIEIDKAGLIDLFENFIGGFPDAEERLKQTLHPTTCTQYKKGV